MAIQRNFDFTKIQRSFFTTKLKDGQKLIVNMPKKSTFEKMGHLQSMEEDEATNEEAFHTIASLMAEVLNNNKNGVKISTEYVIENYDIEEMAEYLKAYMEFASTLQKDPN